MAENFILGDGWLYCHSEPVVAGANLSRMIENSGDPFRSTTQFDFERTKLNCSGELTPPECRFIRRGNLLWIASAAVPLCALVTTITKFIVKRLPLRIKRHSGGVSSP